LNDAKPQDESALVGEVGPDIPLSERLGAASESPTAGGGRDTATPLAHGGEGETDAVAGRGRAALIGAIAGTVIGCSVSLLGPESAEWKARYWHYGAFTGLGAGVAGLITGHRRPRLGFAGVGFVVGFLVFVVGGDRQWLFLGTMVGAPLGTVLAAGIGALWDGPIGRLYRKP
jgi:hypothetical protein